MVLKRLIGLVFAGALAFSSVAMAEVVVRIGPPHAVRENRGRRPSRDHVWISGYHRWDGNAYAWTPGRWEQPPRRGARWEQHRWVHRHDGWVFVEGHWR
jgi:WXXGXW repeat (2 copies)